MIQISDKAAQQIREQLQTRGHDPKTWGLRLGVEGGGCSGFMYKMDFDAAKEDDNVQDADGGRVLIDPKSAAFLEGMTLDWNDGITQAGFTIVNPNAQSSCGCGLSFTV